MTIAKKPNGYVIYEGPSMIDGKPIVAIAVMETRNRKTGDMIQTYILARDVKPTEALKTGADVSVCGDCKHRPVNGGSCYVNVAQGPNAVWKAWAAGGKYPKAQDLAAVGKGRKVRLGAYGDPAAVPAYIWEGLLSAADGHTGYTHQWLNEAIPLAQRQAITRLTMASVDDASEAQKAKAQGLRYFRVRVADEPLMRGEFVCPASAEAGKRKTCAQCMACNGSSKNTAASPVIIVHGVKAGRFKAQRSA